MHLWIDKVWQSCQRGLLFTIFCAMSWLTPHVAHAFQMIGYVEANTHSLAQAGCYYLEGSKKPFFDVVALFAANINGNSPGQAYIAFNPAIDNILNHSNQVKTLQDKGIKVILTLLGNHENAGWSCFEQQESIDKFSAAVANVVQNYNLDGIDIDDEYSACSPNALSLARVAQAISRQQAFKGKILTKALFNDHKYFKASTSTPSVRLANFLDYGSEMSYGNKRLDARLDPYLTFGMSKHNLLIGLSTADSEEQIRKFSTIMQNSGWGGIMFFNVHPKSSPLFSTVAEAVYDTTVVADKDCLAQ